MAGIVHPLDYAGYASPKLSRIQEGKCRITWERGEVRTLPVGAVG